MSLNTDLLSTATDDSSHWICCILHKDPETPFGRSAWIFPGQLPVKYELEQSHRTSFRMKPIKILRQFFVNNFAPPIYFQRQKYPRNSN